MFLTTAAVTTAVYLGSDATHAFRLTQGYTELYTGSKDAIPHGTMAGTFEEI
jgi:hypothetical protein